VLQFTQLGRGEVIHAQDCVAALFWCYIMVARFKNHKLGCEDSIHFNISVPGLKHISQYAEPDSMYFGNSTVTTSALLEASLLLQAPEDEEEGLISNLAFCSLGNACLAIRKALEAVDSRYLKHFATLRGSRSELDDRLEYERCLDRQRTGLVLEDLTFSEPEIPVGMPHVEQDECMQPCFCSDDKEEGKIVMLPRKGHRLGDEPWPVWVCLAPEDMEKLEEQLELDGMWAKPDWW
jgi:hypothetical protein